MAVGQTFQAPRAHACCSSRMHFGNRDPAGMLPEVNAARPQGGLPPVSQRSLGWELPLCLFARSQGDPIFGGRVCVTGGTDKFEQLVFETLSSCGHEVYDTTLLF